MYIFKPRNGVVVNTMVSMLDGITFEISFMEKKKSDHAVSSFHRITKDDAKTDGRSCISGLLRGGCSSAIKSFDTIYLFFIK